MPQTHIEYKIHEKQKHLQNKKRRSTSESTLFLSTLFFNLKFSTSFQHLISYQYQPHKHRCHRRNVYSSNNTKRNHQDKYRNDGKYQCPHRKTNDAGNDRNNKSDYVHDQTKHASSEDWSITHKIQCQPLGFFIFTKLNKNIFNKCRFYMISRSNDAENAVMASIMDPFTFAYP